MTWGSRPVPKVTPETRRFWEAAADGRLLLRQCAGCGLTFFYPRSRCPDCFSEEVEWIEASGDGRVYSYSVQSSVAGWPEEHLPLIVAYIELDEGPRMISNLVDCPPADVAVGDRVVVRFESTTDESIGIPVFTLA